MKNTSLYKLLIASFLVMFSVEMMVGQRATVTVNQNEKIPQLLELKKELEKENKLGSGWTIQLYSGELGRANAILSRFRGTYGAWPASLEYETPNYKVWAGDFSSRIEADRALLEIKEKFRDAFILKPSR